MSVTTVMIDYVSRPRMLLAFAVATIPFIADGVSAPIVVVSFPVTKPVKAIAANEQPEIAGTQIAILAAYKADELVAVPNIIIRDTYVHEDSRTGHDWHRNRNRRRHEHRVRRLWQRRYNWLSRQRRYQ